MDRAILAIFLRETLAGPHLEFRWALGVREAIERDGNKMDLIGEALAAFGEQLKMQGLELTKVGPATLYGPDGRPVA